MCSNIYSNKKEFKRRKKTLGISYSKDRNLVLTLFFLRISSEIKFIQKVSTLPSILIFTEILILVWSTELWDFPNEFKEEHLSTATTAIPVVHSMTWSGHPDENPDQYQGGCSALIALKPSSASSCIWIIGHRDIDVRKSSNFHVKKFPAYRSVN